MLYQLWTFGGLLLWYGDLWESAHSSCNNVFISFLCQVHHRVTNSGLPCSGKACGYFVSDLCQFCQKSLSASYGLCNMASWGHKRLLCSLTDCCTKKRNLECESWVRLRYGQWEQSRRNCRASTRHSQDNGKRKEEKIGEIELSREK